MTTESDIPLNIQPLILSTAPDFIQERDYLHSTVVDELRELCHSKGFYFSPVDLNYKATEEMTDCDDLLQVGLDFLVKGSPFFICILGERYGPHIPPNSRSGSVTEVNSSSSFTASQRLSSRRSSRARRRSTLTSTALHGFTGPGMHWLKSSKENAANSGYSWLLNNVYDNTSFIELLIIQAAFVSGFERCRFYFRIPGHVDDLYSDLPPLKRKEKLKVFAPESDYARAKLEEAKQRLVKAGHSIKYFRTKEELRDAIVEDMAETLSEMPRTTANAKLYDPESHHHEFFSNQRRQNYTTFSLAKQLFKFLSRFADLDSFQENQEALQSLVEDPLFKYYRQDHSKILEESFDKIKKESTVLDAHHVVSIVEEDDVSVDCHQRICLIAGSRGCGKSSHISVWVNKFKRRFPSQLVVEHYVGCGGSSTSLQHMLTRLTRVIRHHYGLHSYEKEPIDKDATLSLRYQSEAFAGALALGPIIIIIDGLDSLSNFSGQTLEIIKSLAWLPQTVPPLCRIILTTTTSDLTYSALCKRDDVVHFPLDTNWSESLEDDFDRMEGIVESFGQKIYEEFKIDFENWPLRSSPLAQILLAQEYHVADLNKDWDKVLSSILESSSIRELCTKIIRQWVARYSWKKLNVVEQKTKTFEPQNDDIKPYVSEWDGWVSDALGFLSLSREGLSMLDLLDLLEEFGYSEKAAVMPIDWLRFQSSASSVLMFKDGIITFTHNHFKQVMEHLFLGNVTPASVESRAYKTERSSFVDSRCKFHSVLADLYLIKGNYMEAVYHLDKSSRFSDLTYLIAEPRVFNKLVSSSSHIDGDLDQIHNFMELWKAIEEAEQDPLSLLIYRFEEITNTTVEGIPMLRDRIDQNSERIRELFDREWDEYRTKKTDTTATDEINESKDDCSPQFVQDITFGWRLANLFSFMGYDLAGYQSQVSIFRLLDKNFLTTAEHLLSKARLCYEIANHPQIGSDLMSVKNWLLCTIDCLGVTLATIDEKDPDIQDLMKEALILKGRNYLRLSELAAKDNSFEEEELYLADVKKVLKHSKSVTLESDMLKRLSVVHHRNKEFKLCHDCLERSIQLQEQWRGSVHLTLADRFIPMALVLADQGWFKGFDQFRSEAYLRKAYHIQNLCLPSESLHSALTAETLARILVRDGSLLCLREAHVLLVAAYDSRAKKLGVNHPLTQMTQKLIRQLEITKPRPPSAPHQKQPEPIPSENENKSKRQPKFSHQSFAAVDSSSQKSCTELVHSDSKLSCQKDKQETSYQVDQQADESGTAPRHASSFEEKRPIVRFSQESRVHFDKIMVRANTAPAKSTNEKRFSRLTPMSEGFHNGYRNQSLQSSFSSRTRTTSRSKMRRLITPNVTLVNTLHGPNSSLDSLLRMSPTEIRHYYQPTVHYKSAWYLKDSVRDQAKLLSRQSTSQLTYY